MNIHDVAQGIHVVVETEGTIFIGRLGKLGEGTVLLRDCAVHPVRREERAERYVRHTAKYGVVVDQRVVTLPVSRVKRVRLLRDVPKEWGYAAPTAAKTPARAAA